MSFARATRRPPLRPESPQARACRERPTSISPRRIRLTSPTATAALAAAPRRSSVTSLASEATTAMSHPAFSLRTCASSRALSAACASPISTSQCSSSVQSADAARGCLAKLLEKSNVAQRQLDTELSALKGISCEVDARLAQQLRRRYASLGPSPPQEEDRREEMEAALQRLQEESNRCRMVKEHMESLIKTAAQVLGGPELCDRRPASVPGFALQLQKQLTAKLQESRVRCRASAQLGLESLQKTELRQDSFAPLPRYPEGSMPMPATAQLAASTAASLALVEELNHGDLKEIPTQIPLQEAPHVRFGVLEDFHRRWREDAVIQEEEEDELMELPRGLGSAAVVDVC
ncbi:Uncharacterized protein SCF082_LOCUS29145 [Durusdinium trenchii]|uniref:Uncharacterized protein n=1 Tax=Durusdinium trenchii TaxID=1381693 RepID=A0ABP0MQG7_9DINO